MTLAQWLEEQGYEPEAQVTQKGEMTLRGGILDVYPPVSPWPVRLEFFGDELESCRHFDPLTQISQEEILAVALPPAGELGILKRLAQAPVSSLDFPPPASAEQPTAPKTGAAPADGSKPAIRTRKPALATLVDYLPGDAIFLLCEPEALAEHAKQYALQAPAGDPFLVAWNDFKAR